MEQEDVIRSGGCACGAVQFTAHGEPLRAGLCHCLTCQKEHAAAFNPFAVYLYDQVWVTGRTMSWRSSPDYERVFCASCGSKVAGLLGSEIEVSICGFDEPFPVGPQYESWTIRRVAWLRPLDVPQFERDRIA